MTVATSQSNDTQREGNCVMAISVKRVALAALVAFGATAAIVSGPGAGTALAGKIGCNSVQENGSSWEAVNGEMDEMGGPKNGAGLGSIEQPIPPGNPEGCFGQNGPLLEPVNPTPTPIPVRTTGVRAVPATKAR